MDACHSLSYLDDSDGAEEKKFPGRSTFLGLGVTFILFCSVESWERYIDSFVDFLDFLR